MDFLRVQCKSARFDRGCALFNGFATDHGKGVTRYRGLADRNEQRLLAVVAERQRRAD
jgi:hypothetical protein